MEKQDQHDTSGLEIAIVGMAGRFPGAPDIGAFWRNIRDGIESTVAYTDAQLRERGVPQTLLDDPAYVKAGVPFEGADQFDAGFFGYTPRDAAQLDPQHRIFLECAWEALEHAGIVPQRFPGRMGVYAGSGASLYLMRQLLPHHQLEDGGNIADLLGLMSGNLADTLCTRVAYKLNLRGPAVTVQTACSTSLMAVHTACQALLNHECDAALAGGVSLNLLQNGGYRYQAGAIFSPDGHCRAFDARAGGTMLGSGAGVVVLKRLEDALQDGDTIHAVIKGSAANNDGADKVGFTAPSISGQADVIRAAQEMAGVSADTIGYVEAHGTGTTLGDPIEIAALTQAFRASSERQGYCAIGSVKTNIGHLDAAAGVTGLIKTALALSHQTLPPSLNFEQPNPQIDFASSPFFVNTLARPWETADAPRRAGVSSFGIGGTNVHVVLEEAPQRAAERASPPQTGEFALQLSARSELGLREMCERLAHRLEQQPELELADVAYTLRTGRQRFAHRAVAMVRDRIEAVRVLQQLERGAMVRGVPVSERPSVAFLFPGQGAQHVDMARTLYEKHEIVRRTVDHCCQLLQPQLGLDLRTLMFPASGADDTSVQLAQTAITQPALFVCEYALAQWWLEQGIRPDALLGHSIGEYVAACLAGVFSLEDALAVVAARGRLMQGAAPGAMLAVSLTERSLMAESFPGCDLAAVNAAESCVLAGAATDIERAEHTLRERGVAVRRLHVSHAFHSASVDPVLEEFEALLASVKLSPPRIPFASNVSGRWVTDAEACDPAYWARHMRGTVRFADGLDELLAKPDRLLLEVGPGETLAGLARRHPRIGARPVLATQCHPDRASGNAIQAARSLASLWTLGVEPEPKVAPPGKRVPLPSYPFERTRYWIEAPTQSSRKAPVTRSAGAAWCYLPAWQRSEAPSALSDAGEQGCFLLFGEPGALTDRLLTDLHAQQRTAVLIERGAAFARFGARQYAVRPGVRADFEQLIGSVEEAFGTVTGVVHLWSLAQGASTSPESVLEDGFYSLLALAQVLAGSKCAITVVASEVEDVAGTEPLYPEKAALHGACKVIPQEFPHLSCRLVDTLPATDGVERLARQVMAEIGAANAEALVAYRGPHRWTKSFVAAGGPGSSGAQLRKHGVYLITGGLGGVGLALAGYLAREWQAKLVLLGRRAAMETLPVVAELKAAGAEVLLLQADVADPAQLRVAVAAARERFGALNGVVHAAGVAGGGMIAVRERAVMEQVFAPKVQGSRNLLQACAGEALDFVLLCSSLTAVAGGFGQADYCAANSVQDAIAAEALRHCSWPVVTVNWDTWRELGMAAGQVLPDGVGISSSQAGALLEQVLSISGSSQVLVSSLDIDERIAQLQSIELAGQVLTGAAPKQQVQPRPALRTAYAEPSAGIQRELAALWSELLGIAPIGAQDNLFELGGDSLLAIQLLARVRQAYGVTLHPARLFETPTVAALAALVGEQDGEGPKGIPHRDRGAAAPLSFSQQRMWFLWKLDPASTAYHLSGGLRFVGALDADALRGSLTALVRRHAALRTVFQESEDGLLEQVVLPPQDVALPCIDLSQSGRGLETEVPLLCSAPFDLAAGPLLRATLLRRAENEHFLIVVMHHIVSDAHSTHIILDELAALYSARVHGQEAQLAAIPIEYADYAAWQRDWMAGEEGGRQAKWWEAQLGKDAPLLALATDRPRAASGKYSVATHSVAIDPDLGHALRQLAQGQGCTLFMSLLTALQAVLFRHSGMDDIRIGVPVANRNRAEVAGMVGFFVNTQVLRAQVDAKALLGDLLLRTRATALDAQAHQDFPFERLVEVLQPARSLAHTPLFQVMFNHLRRDDSSLDSWPGLAVQRVDFEAPNTQFELALETCEHADGRIEATFRYAAELFEPATIKRMANHYMAVLRALASQLHLAVGEVALMDQDEMAQLDQWAEGGTAWPDAQPVHRLFEQQVRAQPEVAALICDAEALSYAELNARANRLAHRLMRLGVRPETRVGIALERSVDMVVALLAVMKAGGAYVPLDPDYPADRLAYMVEDSGIALLLTHGALRGRIPSGGSLPVLELDALALSDEPSHDPQVALHGENLAYVIYTSGSTGRPKGAANRHSALHNRLAWMQDAYRIDSSDTVLQKTPFSFDVSVWEFFWPLMVGARLAMAGPGEHRDPARLVQLIEQHQVTTLHFVPSMLQAFLAQDGIEACRSIRRIICSGEALPAEAQQGVFARLPQAQLYNLYGPTEAAIDVTHWTCRDDGRSQVPIGQPISGTRTLVLDAGLNLAPAGVAGELYLGGAGLARGYLGRAGLTAERFVADPFDPAGGRLYRTGDLVRWNAQGQLEYLGRLDHQVKIRGLRIELGEIEAALLAQPEVREAVVVAQHGPTGPRLVAYVAPHAGHAIEATSLRERLGRSLADYMVPGQMVALEALPLNANGKVDRKALPAAETASASAYEAPQGEVEIALAGIWAEVLGVERVGRHDNFFERGGHSLMAVQAGALLASRHACEVPIRAFFEAATLAAFAARLPEHGWQGSDARSGRMAQMDLLMNEFEV